MVLYFIDMTLCDLTTMVRYLYAGSWIQNLIDFSRISGNVANVKNPLVNAHSLTCKN